MAFSLGVTSMAIQSVIWAYLYNRLFSGEPVLRGAVKFAALAFPLAWSFLVLPIGAKHLMADVTGFVADRDGLRRRSVPDRQPADRPGVRIRQDAANRDGIATDRRYFAAEAATIPRESEGSRGHAATSIGRGRRRPPRDRLARQRAPQRRRLEAGRPRARPHHCRRGTAAQDPAGRRRLRLCEPGGRRDRRRDARRHRRSCSAISAAGPCPTT